MYVVCVQVHVKPEYIDEFIQTTRANYEDTRKNEPGNVRWDLLQSEEDPARFFIYEVYKTKEDFPKHQETPHYKRWREVVAPWMAEPRVGVKYFNVFPDDKPWNK